MNTEKTKKWGGAGRGQGRKPKWYGVTIAMRVPEAWVGDLGQCMQDKITPDFRPKQNDWVQNQDDNVHKQDAMILQALRLYKQGLNGGKIWDTLKAEGFDNLPSKPNMKRTLERWKAEVC